MNVKPLLSICNKNKWLFEKQSFQQIFRSRAYNTTTTISFPAQSVVEIQTSHDDSKQSYVNPLRFPDFFEVDNLVKIKELFDARVHLGHKLGSLNDKMRPYVFGSRFEHVIFDLEQTAVHLRKALNFTAHIAYRGGIILFASNYHQHCSIIEQTAKDCREYAHTREWKRGLLTNSRSVFGSVIRNPDLCIILNTLDSVFCQHHIVNEAAKLTIPTIAIVDSNCDPTIITYPIPGNDDSLLAIELYLNLFKQAILKGKTIREKEIEEDQN